MISIHCPTILCYVFMQSSNLSIDNYTIKILINIDALCQSISILQTRVWFPASMSDTSCCLNSSSKGFDALL